MFLLVLLLIGNSGVLVTSNDITITTSYGPVQGYTTEIPGTQDPKYAQLFLGIPYAKPPVGDLRFEKPQPPNPWKAVLSTTEFGPVCVGQNRDDGQEDCLTLNVFAPVREESDTRLFPVYVYIHGGGFDSGSSAMMEKEGILKNVVAEDIVVVTIEYRLGSLGFLFTNLTHQIPNVGILDQIQALEWVRDNIDRFGGDPKRVTLSGESAGAASVSWITLSPLSRGLYAQTLTASGSALDIWASSPDTVKDSTQRLILLSGCQDAQDVIQCLKDKPIDQFWQAAKQIVADEVHFGVWHPVFHESLVGSESKTIAEALENAPIVPQLSASASQEWKVFMIRDLPGANYIPISLSRAKSFSDKDLTNFINYLFGLSSIFGSRTSEAANSIVNFYTSEAGTYTNYGWTSAFVQSVSDVLFNIGNMREALHRAKAGAPVYFLLHECTNYNNAVIDGCPHGSIGEYLYNNIEVVLRFIKTGEPWEGYRVNSTNIPFYHGSGNGGFGNSLWPERLEFWNKFYETFGYDWPSGSRDKP